MSRLLQTIKMQGQVCAGMGSAMYGDLLPLIGNDVETGGIFARIFTGHENDSGRMALPLRLLGGLHRLALDGRSPALRRWYPSAGGQWNAEAAWPDIVTAADRHAEYLRAALDQPPQTNEVGRSAALIGGLLALADRFDLPIGLFEIGCSAGLNLRADHYRYRYPGGDWGPADSPVTIDDAWRGDVPPTADLNIVERHGYDLAPLDATGPEGELTLARSAGPARPPARRDQRRASGASDVAPPQRHRSRGRAGPCRREADRVVAFDYVAIPFAARTVDDLGGHRGDWSASHTRVAVRPSDARTAPAHTAG
jgi:hypothetical protein